MAGGPVRDKNSTSRISRLWREGLKANGVETIDAREVDDPGGARWTLRKIERVAHTRQEMINDAVINGVYELWLVDDDVIVGPGVLDRMRQAHADVVYGNFLTSCNWGGYPDLWPQVWMTHPYGFRGHPLHLEKLRSEQDLELEVKGGGACTLLRGRALRQARYAPLLEGLRSAGGMWCGEDRTFAMYCEVHEITQLAVVGQPIMHLHECDDLTEQQEKAVREYVGL